MLAHEEKCEDGSYKRGMPGEAALRIAIALLRS